MNTETRLDIKLDTVTFKADPAPHIVVQAELCQTCDGNPCVTACPARLLEWLDEQMVFNCESCLECGSCRIVCPHDALQWRYPIGGYGVRYRWG